MGDARDEENDEALRARLDKLSVALDARSASSKAAEEVRTQSDVQRSARAVSIGLRVLSEFVAAVLVGAFLGWLVDRIAGASPWGLVCFLMLGLAAGFWNVYRIATTTEVEGDS
jgi:ATP synthase protein I